MFDTLSDDTFAGTVSGTQAGVLLFYKKLCPHCLNMEKVLQKFAGMMPAVTLLRIDSEENPVAAKEYDALRAPTVVVIKNGKLAGRKAGLMNPKEMLAFYQEV